MHTYFHALMTDDTGTVLTLTILSPLAIVIAVSMDLWRNRR